ncbi:hypothetical protein NEIRO03_1078 [Nematocida sp. AWRm78]|nr:hypothetical protein NEIRO02_1147 [Nematocida sp. AWRm79]KAI5183483.1 hypothetical protein NEIRO03_1078 [Nematocida sp. AWRm78]
MIIMIYTILVLSMYFGIGSAEICYDKRANIKQGKKDKVYVDMDRLGEWPRNREGRQNIDSLCAPGYICLPNRTIEPSKGNPVKRKPVPLEMKNSKFKAKRYKPSDVIGEGCLGLDRYNEVGIQSAETQLYLGACSNCTGTASVKYNTIGMVYTTFNNEEAKWKFIPEKGKCTIKSVHTGKYLSRCDNCAPMIQNIPMVALFREAIDDNTNDDMWVVTRKTDGNYVFKSASNGGYLGVCVKCLAQHSVLNDAATIFNTGPDQSFVAWSVNIDPETEMYA